MSTRSRHPIVEFCGGYTLEGRCICRTARSGGCLWKVDRAFHWAISDWPSVKMWIRTSPPSHHVDADVSLYGMVLSCSRHRAVLQHVAIDTGRIVQNTARRARWLSSSKSRSTDQHSVVDHERLDLYLAERAQGLLREPRRPTPLSDLFRQYREKAYTVIPAVVPYDERPIRSARAEEIYLARSGDDNLDGSAGNGIVTVAYLVFRNTGSSLDLERTALCSGFVLNAKAHDLDKTDTIVTCAHTLHEIDAYLGRQEHPDNTVTIGLILTRSGRPKPIRALLSSLPRNDLIILETSPLSASDTKLRSIPLTPFPVYHGTQLLTYLFSAPDPPLIKQSVARTRQADSLPNHLPLQLDTSQSMFDGHAYSRLAKGTFLGYRSFSGLELEAGIHSSLPHILTSVLPTPGSSGGPIINADTGCVVGCISGRRMDNRLEGERGWGSSAEGIFECFQLPGFQPSQTQMAWSR